MENISTSTYFKTERKTIKIVIFIFAVVFLFPFFSIVNNINYHNKIKNILVYGVETQATVVENSLKSLTEDIYIFEYAFYDNQGKEHYSYTESNYDFNTAKKQYDAGLITIKYDAETFDSVEIPYEFSAPVPLYDIFLSIIDISLWIYLLIELIKFIRKKGVLLFGKQYIATYSSKQIANTINHNDLYKIMYVWKDEKGNTHDGVSKDVYTLLEANAFETAKVFKIKAHKNKSVIVTSPKWLDVQNEKRKARKKYYYCIYCGTKFLNNEDACPNCGAPQKEVKEEIDL